MSLRAAAESGDLEEVVRLLTEGEQIDRQDEVRLLFAIASSSRVCVSRMALALFTKRVSMGMIRSPPYFLTKEPKSTFIRRSVFVSHLSPPSPLLMILLHL
jgi:hypothetical protein